jgi:cytochrome bd-type quinol oxidase subunit 2
MQRFRLALALFALRNRQLLMLATFGVFMCLVAPSHAHALSIDFSDITSQWASVKGFAIFAASAIACFMIIMTIIKLVGRDWGEAIMYASGAAICGFVAAHASQWISNETGASL